jgi:hypothetical protein
VQNKVIFKPRRRQPPGLRPKGPSGLGAEGLVPDLGRRPTLALPAAAYVCSRRAGNPKSGARGRTQGLKAGSSRQGPVMVKVGGFVYLRSIALKYELVGSVRFELTIYRTQTDRLTIRLRSA